MASSDAATRRLVDALDEATREMLALSRRPGPAKERTARLEKLDRERDELEAKLAARSEDFASARRLPTPKPVADALPEGAALVDFL
ncbi:MAG: hypothetical protein K2X91_19195, partial [Thermoleophilia bacterium]|nr:hypothetical protein [Thermoleophilia bacterium]